MHTGEDSTDELGKIYEGRQGSSATTRSIPMTVSEQSGSVYCEPKRDARNIHLTTLCSGLGTLQARSPLLLDLAGRCTHRLTWARLIRHFCRLIEKGSIAPVAVPAHSESHMIGSNEMIQSHAV